MKRPGSLQRKTRLKPRRFAISDPRLLQRQQEKELDGLCRRLVVEVRDRNVCQRCGARAESSQMHWSHVVTRGAKSIRWTEWNSKAMCAGCHMWWGSHPVDAGAWWRAKFPERAALLDAWRQQRRRPKVDRQLIRLYLLQQLGE